MNNNKEEQRSFELSSYKNEVDIFSSLVSTVNYREEPGIRQISRKIESANEWAKKYGKFFPSGGRHTVSVTGY